MIVHLLIRMCMTRVKHLVTHLSLLLYFFPSLPFLLRSSAQRNKQKKRKAKICRFMIDPENTYPKA